MPFSLCQQLHSKFFPSRPPFLLPHCHRHPTSVFKPSLHSPASYTRAPEVVTTVQMGSSSSKQQFEITDRVSSQPGSPLIYGGYQSSEDADDGSMDVVDLHPGSLRSSRSGFTQPPSVFPTKDDTENPIILSGFKLSNADTARQSPGSEFDDGTDLDLEVSTFSC